MRITIGCCLAVLLITGCGEKSADQTDASRPADQTGMRSSADTTNSVVTTGRDPQPPATDSYATVTPTPEDETPDQPAVTDPEVKKPEPGLVLEDLRSPTALIRKEAVQNLADMPEQADVALPVLLPMLDDEDAGIAQEARSTIRKLTWQPGPVLVDIYADWCPPCRKMAPIIDELKAEGHPIVKVNYDVNKDLARRMQTIVIPTFSIVHDGKIETQAFGEVPKARLLEMLKAAPKADGSARGVPADLQVFGKLAALFDGDPWFRYYAMIELTSAPEETIPAVTTLVGDLEQPTMIRAAAINTLTAISQDHPLPPATETLLADLLKDDSTALEVRGYAALHRSRQDAEPQPEVVNALILALRASRIEELSLDAAAELGRRKYPAAIPALTGQMQSTRAAVVSASIAALGEYGVKAEDAVPDMLASYREVPLDARESVFDTVGKIYPGSKTATAALVGALNSDDPDVRQHAAATLQNAEYISGMAEPLTEALESREPQTRRIAAVLLGKVGGHARQIVPVMIESLGNEQPDWEARSILSRSGSQAAPALTEVIVGDDTTPAARTRAAAILGQIQWLPVPLQAELEAALDRPDQHVRTAAAIALARRGSQPSGILPALVAGLNSDSKELRAASITAITRLPHGKEAVTSVLVDALQNADETVSESAAYGLQYRKLSEAELDRMVASLADPDHRRLALTALSERKDLPQAALDAAAEIVRNGEERELSSAIELLRSAGTAAVPQLAAMLNDGDLENSRRASAGRALGQIARRESAAIPALKTALEDSDQTIRTVAAAGLAGTDTDIESLLPPLVAGLKSEEWEVRYPVTDAIRNLTGKSQSAIPTLLKSFEELDEKARTTALDAVNVTATDSPEFRAALVKLARDSDDEQSQRTAVRKLVEFDEHAAEDLISLLKRPDSKLPLIVLKSLMGRNELVDDYRDPLTGLLQSEDPAILAAAAFCLLKATPDSQPAVDVITDVLRSGDEDALDVIRDGLYQLRSKHPNLVPVLVELLDDPQLRGSAIRKLGEIGAAAAPAVPHLIERLESVNDFQAAAAALGQIGEKASAATPVLMTMLDNERTMQWATDALVKIGVSPTELAPVLKKHLDDDSLRISAVRSLGSLAETAPGEVEPSLLAVATSDDPEQVFAAVHALGSLKTPAAARELAEKVRSDHKLVRVAAAGSLGRAGIEPEISVPALITVLDSDDPEMRRTATYALGNYGADAAPAVPRLLKALNDETDYRAAANVLGKIGEPAREAVPRLIEMLDDPDRRYAAVEGLTNFGPLAGSAVNQLQALRVKSDPYFKRQVESALKSIEGAESEESTN